MDTKKVAFTVSEFSDILKTLIEDSFYDIKIRGEISGLKTGYASGYYFDIKDEFSKLKCIVFKNDVRKINFEIKDGLSVIVYGRVGLYAPRGEYNFIVSDIEPYGYGELYAMFERLKEKLGAEGLFDESRKRPLPFLPGRIGIATSRSGAVLHDMVKIINERFPGIPVTFANASVQGKNAAAEIAGAIELLNLYSKKVAKIDVIIVGRGGGSIEDLWPFNEEITARAIFSSLIPVISAVGHETDWTIADMAADMRASTPSNAAEMAVPVKKDLLNQVKELFLALHKAILDNLDSAKSMVARLIRDGERFSPERRLQDKTLRIYDLSERMLRAVNGNLNGNKTEISHLGRRLLLKSPSNLFALGNLKVANLTERLKKSVRSALSGYKERFRSESKSLVSLSPYNVLRRGYGIVFAADGSVIASVSKTGPGDGIKIVLSDGDITATVGERKTTIFQ